MRNKCSTDQGFICTEVTSYKIHTLVLEIKNLLYVPLNSKVDGQLRVLQVRNNSNWEIFQSFDRNLLDLELDSNFDQVLSDLALDNLYFDSVLSDLALDNSDFDSVLSV